MFLRRIPVNPQCVCALKSEIPYIFHNSTHISSPKALIFPTVVA